MAKIKEGCSLIRKATIASSKYIFLYLVGCLGLINIIIFMIPKIGQSHDRHHVFNNVRGKILIVLIVFRLEIILKFIGECTYTELSSQQI